MTDPKNPNTVYPEEVAAFKPSDIKVGEIFYIGDEAFICGGHLQIDDYSKEELERLGHG